MYHKGKFYPFDSILAALLYPGLGWGINKIRFGLVGLYLRLTNNWQALEKTTVDAWMRKWAGDKVYEEMWEPLVIGKFGENYAKQVNMAWMWARMHARTTRLGTYQGGFQAFADDFAAILTERGVNIQLSTPVSAIVPLPKAACPDHPGWRGKFRPMSVHRLPRAAGKAGPRPAGDYLQGLLASEKHGRRGADRRIKQPVLARGLLLVQHAQEGGLSLPGAGRTHQLRLAGTTLAAITSSTAATISNPITNTSA